MAMAAGEIRRFGGIRRGKRLGLGRSHTRRWEKDSGRFRDLYMGWLGAQGREDPERIGAGCTKSPLRDGEERKGKKTASAMWGRTVATRREKEEGARLLAVLGRSAGRK